MNRLPIGWSRFVRVATLVCMAGVLLPVTVMALPFNLRLTVANTNQGSITVPVAVPPQMVTNWYAVDDTAILTAVPSVGYAFSSWKIVSGDATITDPSQADTTIFCDGPVTNVRVSAEFKLPDLTMTVISTNGWGAPMTPPIGDTVWSNGATITASITSPYSLGGGNLAICTGFVGTGSAPASGTALNNITFQIKTNSSIKWYWRSQSATVPLTVTSTNKDGVLVGNPRPDQGTTNMAYGTVVAARVDALNEDPLGNERTLIVGYTGTGDVGSGNGAAVNTPPLTQASSIHWNWRTEYLLSIQVGGDGTGTVSRLPAGLQKGNEARYWYGAGSNVFLTATPGSGSYLVGWFGDILGLRLTNSVLMNGPRTVQAVFANRNGDADGDQIPDSWELLYGIEPWDSETQAADVNNGPLGDPDNDGLLNVEEFAISLQLLGTNFLGRGSSPIHADSDDDSLDDGYEYWHVSLDGITNKVPGTASNATAIVRGTGGYGPEGNPDGDLLWNTETGYRTEVGLTTSQEYQGPDGIPPGTWFPSVSLPGISQPVFRYTPNPIDTGDQSSSDTSDSEIGSMGKSGDGFDDGFEYVWDQWQQQHGGDPVGDPLGHRVPFALGIGPQPTAAVAGDWTGDKTNDVLISNYGLNEVALFITTNGMLLATPRTFPVGLGPVAMAIGSFDTTNTVNNDVVVANSLTNTISVLLAHPSNLFTRADYTVGTTPSYVALGDFNGDRYTDIAVANKGDGTVSVLTNNGTGTFGTYATVSVGGAPCSVAAGWLWSAVTTNPVPMDLLVADWNSGNVIPIQNAGGGAFPLGVAIPVGMRPSSVVIGDWDRNGTNDFAVTITGNSTMRTFLGQGGGTFSAFGALSTGQNGYPLHLASGYLDIQGTNAADGDLDLSVAAFSNASGRIYLGTPLGTMVPAPTLDLTRRPVWVTMADVTGDKTNDLIFVYRDTGSFAVWTGWGDGSLTPRGEYGAASVVVDRRFNPGTIHSLPPDSGQADFDLIYNPGGGVGDWFTDDLEYHAWDIGLHSNKIIRTKYPDRPRSTHPFLWDADGDGMPDGWEVTFGYDPWARISFGGAFTDGDVNPDLDGYANDGTRVHHAVYLATNFSYGCHNFNPQTGWQCPDPTKPPPYTKPYGNRMEMLGGRLQAATIARDPGDRSTNPRLRDTDRDGVWDGWELYVGLNPINTDDGGYDVDLPEPPGDGLSNLREFLCTATLLAEPDWVYANGQLEVTGALTPPQIAAIQARVQIVTSWQNKTAPTDPYDKDTDDDQISDGAEKAPFNFTGGFGASTPTIDPETGEVIYEYFLGGGLNPTSADTDGDCLPDLWESKFTGTVDTNGLTGGGMDGTAEGDAIVDSDGDGLFNYQEYLTGCVPHWQYRGNGGDMLWTKNRPLYGYEPWDFFDETKSTTAEHPNGDAMVGYGGRRVKYWDPHFWLDPLGTVPFNIITASQSSKIYRYSTTDPRERDTDEDNMDDYWETYHMLNPIRSDLRDLVTEKVLGMPYVIEIWSGDLNEAPWVNGEMWMDSDQDGLPNIYESIQPNAPDPNYYHTDPSPYWMSDISYDQSWVNLYYWSGFQFGLLDYNWFYWVPSIPPPQYYYDFEMNEGFDTDNDNLGDRAELVDTSASPGSTDPLESGDPIKRRALYLNGASAARTFMGAVNDWMQLRTFTVEAWVRPANPASGAEQVIVERPGDFRNGNSLGSSADVRLNFRLGLDPTGRPFVGYTGGGYDPIFEQPMAVATAVLKANQWCHLAGVYDGIAQKLILYVDGIAVAMTPSAEIPFNGHFGGSPTTTNTILEYVIPMPIVIGARDKNPGGEVNGSTILVTSMAGQGFSQPNLDHHFEGWVDEVRIWSGARTRSQISNTRSRRFTRADVTQVNASNDVEHQLLYAYGFDDLPDPDHDGVAPAGFELLTSYPNFGTPYAGSPWWASASDRSQVYNEYRYIPWIENLNNHVAKNPPDDSETEHSPSNQFPNTSNPYIFQYLTVTPVNYMESHPFIGGVNIYGDMLPLGWAQADEDVPMWDNDTIPAIDPFDTDGDGMPDDWETANGFDPLDSEGINGADGDPDEDGLGNYYEYLTGSNPWSGDTDGDTISDLNEDPDGDELSNDIEINYYGTSPADPDTDDDGTGDGAEVDRLILKPDGHRVTSPVDSRSPFLPKSMIANGVPLLLPARAKLWDPDRFDMNNWTLEAWVRPQSSNETGSVLLRRLEDGRTNFALRLENNYPVVEFTTVTGVPYKGRGGAPIPSNSWTHIAGTLSGDSLRLSLYVNGLLMTNAVVVDACATGAGETTMGQGLNAAIDDVRIWSIVRDSTDIRSWYDKTYRDTSLKVSDTIIVTVSSNNAAPVLLNALLSGPVPSGVQALQATLTGATLASGVFEGFPVLPSKMPRPAKGVILSSGNVKDAELRSNTSGSKTTAFGTAGDGDLSVLAGGGETHDAVSLTLTFWSDVSIKGLSFDFIFCSEEFPEWVGTPFNDDFGVFLDGANIAFDKQGLPVSVNNNFFELNNDIWNMGNLATSGKRRVVLPLEYDGLTPLLTTSKALKPGFHTVKFVIADTGDSVLDSAVFISRLRFRLETEGTGKAMRDLRAYYMFDDGQNTTITNKLTGAVKGHGAEDFTYPLEWSYALTGCVFSATNVVAPLIELKNDEDADGLPDWWELFYFGIDISPDMDSDGDGLQNLYEFWAGTDPDTWDTDTDGFNDYDSRKGPGYRTYGELYDDGDGMPDAWENLYKGLSSAGKHGPDPSDYDGNLDPDEDGWSNYAEYLAGTDPIMADSVPRPIIEVHGRYRGVWGATLADAITTRGSTVGTVAGEAAGTLNAGAVYVAGVLSKGNIIPGSVNISAGAAAIASDNSNGSLQGTYTGGSVSGGINYETGGWYLTLAGAGFGTTTPITASYGYQAGGGQVKLLFYKTAAMDDWPVATLDMDGDFVRTSTLEGHLVEGNNYMFGYLDRNSNNKYDPDSDPAGIAQFNPINIGLGTVNNIELGLTDTMPGYSRITWPADATASTYIVLDNDFGMTTVIRGPRNYLHEGDFLYNGRYGFAASFPSFTVYKNDLDHLLAVIMAPEVRSFVMSTPSVATPHDTVFAYARNELEFRVDTNATNYRLQIAATSNGTAILSTTNIVPYRDIYGVSKAPLPFYAGDNYVPVGSNYASSVWTNGRYWVRVEAASPSSSALSPWSAFYLNLQMPLTNGKSTIGGDIYYFGKVSRGYGAGQTNSLTMIVQAFKSEGFSGEPDAQVQVSYRCDTNAPSAKKGDYLLMGLHSGKFVIRAFIDVNGNRKLDAFEPVGAVQLPSTDGGYRPQVIDATDSAGVNVTAMRIIIRDRDTDNDQLPDAWEWMYYGRMLGIGAYDMGTNGLTLLRNYEIEPYDLDPLSYDYDKDGLHDRLEITYNEYVVARRSDSNLTVAAWMASGLGNDQHYEPYPPAPTSEGTDLNPAKWDTDGDGMSDGYEMAHGLDPLDPNGDADGDGVPDADEVLTMMTSPTAASDVLRLRQVAAVTPGEGLFTLTWEGKDGVVYQVQYSDELRVWTDIPGTVTSGAGAHVYTGQSPVEAKRFYRVVVK